MRRTITLLLTALVLTGCASTQKLTQKSEQNLAGGDHWRAWQLATRALDRAPANPRAREAATAAAASIGQDWERRVRALAATDSLSAAAQVLEYVEFRSNAARYVTAPVGLGWPDDEHALRQAAARIHYQRGVEASASRRPKRAHGHFAECERYVASYRDAATLADRAMEKALTRVAVVPFRGPRELCGDVTAQWRTDAEQALSGHARYTRVLPGAAIDAAMPVAQLGRVTRDEAIRIGRKAGAQRVIWGTLGDVTSRTRLELFHDVVCRQVREKGADGEVATRWVDVPIEVVARLRDVSVPVGYEVIRTRDGATLATQQVERSTSARVVWTSYQPAADLDAYALVSETVRHTDPDRVKRVETRWKAVCGAATLRDVLGSRAESKGRGRYDRSALARFAAGAAFVFLDELPPADDLALAALSHCTPLDQDLLRLDAIDDVDLGTGSAGLDDH